MASQKFIILIIAAVNVLPTCAQDNLTAAKAPDDLPAEYLGVDSRVAYYYWKVIGHKCSYPNDPFHVSCAELTDMEYSKERPWPFSGPFPAVCGHCIAQGLVHHHDRQALRNHAFFCSKDLVNGSWQILQAYYHDTSCQSFANEYGIQKAMKTFGGISIPAGSRPPKSPKTCDLDFGGKCSPSKPRKCAPHSPRSREPPRCRYVQEYPEARQGYVTMEEVHSYVV